MKLNFSVRILVVASLLGAGCQSLIGYESFSGPGSGAPSPGDPVARDDSFTVPENGSAATLDVLANDQSASSATIASTTQPAHGVVAIAEAGARVTYAPATGYCNDASGGSPDTFTYTLAPGASTATASVTVKCDQPDFTGQVDATFTVGMAGMFQLAATGSTPIVFTNTGNPLPAGIELASTGLLSGTPSAGTGGVFHVSFTANNDVPPAASEAFTLTVDEAPTITSATTGALTTGTFGSLTIKAAGFPAPALSESGALPSGVTFVDNQNGTATLSGTAATTGDSLFNITATNNVGAVATQVFTLHVSGAPIITSLNTATFEVGVADTFTVVSTSFPANAMMTHSGALPSGLTFIDNGNGTATIAGTPAANTGNSYILMLTASNGTAPDAVQSFTLVVDQAPQITSAFAVTFRVGVTATFTVTTSGFPSGAAMKLTVAGTLPPGVTFVDNDNGTATISGTPAANAGGSYAIAIGAANAAPPNASQSFTITVVQAPVFVSGTFDVFSAEQPESFTVQTTGAPAAVITESGPLPGGVTFVDNHNGTATLQGTPTPRSGGSYMLEFAASNGIAPDVTQTFTLTVDQAPLITSGAAATFKLSRPSSFTVKTSGFPADTMVITETGALPTGVTFTDQHDGTALLAGTTTGSGSGSGSGFGFGSGATFPITLTASNGIGSPINQAFTLIVSHNTVSFAAPTSFGTAQEPSSLVIDDLNADGELDLVVGTSQSVEVLLNDTPAGAAAAQFGAEVSISGSAESGIAVADINGDSKPEIVVLRSGGSGAFDVFLNSTVIEGTTPSFQLAAHVLLGAAGPASTIVMGDFDGDGKPDIMTTSTSGTVFVFLNVTDTDSPSPAFAAPVTVGSGGGNSRPALGDFDGDGRLDYVLDEGTRFAVVRNTTTAGVLSFAAAQTFPGDPSDRGIATDTNARAVDFTGDGLPDIVTCDNNDLGVLENTSTPGSLAFTSVSVATHVSSFVAQFAVADFDGDGRQDVAVATGSDVEILVNATLASGPITFSPAFSVSAITNLQSLAAADVSDDGTPDLLCWGTSSSVSVLLDQ
jgi:hypothetical protein